MSSSSPSPEIDEEALYGVFLNNQRWREKLSRRATHKALDLADEDMNISVQKGMTWRELLILGLMCPAGLGVLLATHQFLAASPATPPPEPPAVQVDTDTQYEFDISSGKRSP